jgi:hypothetical protein
MTTVPLPDPDAATGRAGDGLDTALRREAPVFGAVEQALPARDR